MARTDPPFIVKGFCSCDVTDRVPKVTNNTINHEYNDTVDLLRLPVSVVVLLQRRTCMEVSEDPQHGILRTFFIVIRLKNEYIVH